MAERVDHTGEVVGKYLIIAREGYERIRKKTLYTVKCLWCGAIIKHKTYQHIKEHCKNKCGHNVDMDEYDVVWSDPRLRIKFITILNRCTNPGSTVYHLFGGRGITICDEWRTNPQAFNDWAMANGFNDNTIIMRRDSNKGFNPDNCYIRPWDRSKVLAKMKCKK